MTAPRWRTPPHYVAWRTVTVAITLLILLLAGLGAAGIGPLGHIVVTHAQHKVTAR